MIRRITMTLLMLVASSLLLVACGGDEPTKSEFEDGLREVQNHLDDANKASVEASGEVDGAKRTAAIRDQGAALTAAADAADELEAPEDVEKHAAKFQKALRDYATLFDKLVAADGDSQKEAELLGDAGPIVDDLTAANKAIDEAGYQATGNDSDDDES
ncbi:MAG: hypothetical protein JWO69_1157 [Thermoleophilia bacterium]|jgi:major membrane immunogen (membrane-anchored lipoprotein)|nr:hypothetical protein [Thermoleophilia bacterium]